MSVMVKCPTCSQPVEWSQEQRWRPFCSERCRLIDFGEWVDGVHRIPGESHNGNSEDDSVNSLSSSV